MATKRPCTHPVHHLSGHLSSLTNFTEFLAFRALSSPVLCRVPLLRVILQAATASVSKLKDLSEALQLEHGRNFAVFFLALQGRESGRNQVGVSISPTRSRMSAGMGRDFRDEMSK
jgi:hypothetical protein